MADKPDVTTQDQSIRKRVLDPADRIGEVLFGLIMVLTFTGSLSVAEAGREDVRAMLIAALGCNIAWGLIDGVLYLMSCLAERGRDLATYRAVVRATNAQHAHRLIADVLPPAVASVLQPEELERIRQRLLDLQPPARGKLSASDWWGGCGVFLIVFLSTFPVALPFMFIQRPITALRTSNAVAVTMMFIAGVAYGRLVGHTPWIIGTSMVALGCVLVALTIALGG